ncbi:unnamed protein product, partial [Gulo gulo]
PRPPARTAAALRRARGPGWTRSDTAVTAPCHLILPPPDLYKEMSLRLPSFYCEIHRYPSPRKIDSGPGPNGNRVRETSSLCGLPGALFEDHYCC